ncbi:hypothetical protein CKY51_09390 [Xanthomonas maliensis]|nr:hypothetical protein CKY51_09390 [Xanthomonas maliensis]
MFSNIGIYVAIAECKDTIRFTHLSARPSDEVHHPITTEELDIGEGSSKAGKQNVECITNTLMTIWRMHHRIR